MTQPSSEQRPGAMSEHDPPAGWARKNGPPWLLVIAVVLLVIAAVVLHLTGVVGPGSH
jgi:hypothetical protein